MPMHEGLPVAGYQPQTESRVDLINANKATEERLLRLIESLQLSGTGDPRCLALAKTHLETGFMWLNRAIFQPVAGLIQRVVEEPVKPQPEHYGKPAWAADPLPPALASRLPRWEYRVVGFTSTTPSTSEVQGILNHMGQAGWQLVHGTPGALFFKRRLIP